MSFVDSPLGCHGYDDEVEFNTQCSSQWDSLCHFHHQPSQSGYNGAKTNVQELTQTYGNEDKDQKLPTLNHWHQRGGLVARGVLLDYVRYAEENGIKYSCYTDHRITIDVLEKIAKSQGVEFKTGDVLIVRSGFTEGLTGISGEKQGELMGSHKTCGVEGTTEAAKWHWNKHFAAVAGDAIAYEAIPPIREDGSAGDTSELVLHQYSWVCSVCISASCGI